MDALQKSWSSISSKKADTYLDDYPRYNKLQLANFLKSRLKKPRVLELGCGSLLTYQAMASQFAATKHEFEYVGVDFSKPLIDSSKKRFPNVTLVYQEIVDYLRSYNGPKFDAILLSHIFELVESQDLLLHLCAQKASLIIILWYEPPSHAFHSTEIKISAHPQETAYAPYLRIKTSTDFYKHLLEKHNLKIIHKLRNPALATDVMHVLEKNEL